MRHLPYDIFDLDRILGDVLALRDAVTSRDSGGQDAVIVAQSHRQTVDLGLDEKLRVFPELFPHGINKLVYFFFAEHVLQRKHGDVMLNFLALARLPTYAERRRIGTHDGRILLLDLLEAVILHVVFVVADLRRILVVVTLGMVVELRYELTVFFFDIRGYSGLTQPLPEKTHLFHY